MEPQLYLGLDHHLLNHLRIEENAGPPVLEEVPRDVMELPDLVTDNGNESGEEEVAHPEHSFVSKPLRRGNPPRHLPSCGNSAAAGCLDAPASCRQQKPDVGPLPATAPSLPTASRELPGLGCQLPEPREGLPKKPPILIRKAYPKHIQPIPQIPVSLTVPCSAWHRMKPRGVDLAGHP